MITPIRLLHTYSFTSSAYQECTDEAVPTFMAFFAGKTIAAIRAPDTQVFSQAAQHGES